MSQVVIGDILPYTQATATLNQTVFGTNWTANTESDVVVYVTPPGDEPNDVTQILPYPAGYSVAFIGSQQDVQVTLVTPSVAGAIVTITRQTPADRMNLYTNTNFLPSMLNNDFGILTLVDQQAQLVDQKIGPRYNYSATIVDVVDTILPILGANETWVKNPSNTAFIPYELPSGGIAPADATYVTITDETAVLPNSVNFAGFSAGIVAFTGSGFVSNPILGTAHEIDVANATGVAGSVTLSFPLNMVIPGTGSVGLPGGTTAERVITASGTPLRYNSTFDSLEFYSSGTWSLINDDTDGTINPGLANELAYYAANGNTLSGLTGANGAVLVTDNTGVMSWISGSATTGNYVQSVQNGTPIWSLIKWPDSLTTYQLLYAGSTNVVNALNPGNSAALCSTQTGAPEWVSATGTGRYLQSVNNDIAIWSAITWPTDVTTYQLLYAGSDHVVNALNPALSSVLTSTQTGAPDWVGPLTDGQLIIGSTGLQPVGAAITQGTGLVVTNGPGSITLALNVAAVPALTMAGNIDFANTYKGINALDPTNPQDYATKNYVDQTALTGTSVYAASAASLGTVTQSGAGVGATLTNAGAQATFALDGVNPPAGSTVLIKNTATGMTAANEGIYTVTNAGSGATNWVLTRDVDYDTPEQINDTGLIVVRNGSTLAGTGWYNTSTIVTVDTTNFSYSQFGSGGTVTSIATANGITGGTITSTGTIQLASMFNINASAPANSLTMDANGVTQLANNPSFYAQLGSAVTDVTGDGTVYTIIFATENYDIGGGYNPATGIFTAPVAGKYIFRWGAAINQLGASHTSGDGLYLHTSNEGNQYTTIGNYFAMSSSGVLYLYSCAICTMTAGATAEIRVMIAGGTKTVDIGDTGASQFRGMLIP
jgi:hypothetical protein